MKGSLQQSTGMKAVWGMGMIILAILIFMYLGSVSYMFDAQTFRLLQYLVTVFGFMSLLVIWWNLEINGYFFPYSQKSSVLYMRSLLCESSYFRLAYDISYTELSDFRYCHFLISFLERYDGHFSLVFHTSDKNYYPFWESRFYSFRIPSHT
jgi:hypothetical protein